MPPDAQDPTIPRSLPLGVNLAGYFDATLGLGEAARQVEAALRAAGVAVARVPLAHPSAPAATAPSERADHPVTVVCVSPEGMDAARAQAPAAFAGRRVVGLWWWEVLAFPSRWMRAFDDVDEVWVGSRFVADVLGAVSPVPVVRMPMPVAARGSSGAGRAALGLPAGFLFGFVFDYSSVVERKNPVGLIEAFSRAFPAGGDHGAALVLKTLAGDRHPREHAAVMAAAERHPDVHVIDRDLPAADRDALIGALDCYVSLHRSEGFGLTIAEAALLGTPVIATDYGGPRDFLTPFNSALVDRRIVPIGPGHDPYPPEGEWAEPDLDHAAARMREVRAAPAEAQERAARARADVEREHAPAAAGGAMAERLARVLGAPHGRDGSVAAVDVGGVAERIRQGPAGGAAATTALGRARGTVRTALLRALRPYSVHQRLVDEELVRLVRTLDERVRGIAAAQTSLAAEVARLRDGAEAATVERDAGPGEDAGRSVPDRDRVPPSAGS
ncbi:MAG: hypothetical protein QOD55_483 [Solirubrobacteraceae bacterium]|nr:hypothetical protein [Solirubrobacteraceae bacterium]